MTWSFVSAGKGGVASTFSTGADIRFGGDRTSDAQTVTGPNVLSVFRDAFASWEEIAGIKFVQVSDDGKSVGQGKSADIRVAFGQIDDEQGKILGKGTFPTDPVTTEAGDILMDEDDYRSISSFNRLSAVAVHEIGHAIELGHVDDTGSVMNPIITRNTAPQSDDIAGARQIYGRPLEGLQSYLLSADTPNLRILQNVDDLEIIGTARANSVFGSFGDESLIGLGGGDELSGGAGSDTLVGGGGRDKLFGGNGGDLISGDGGRDAIEGGRGRDILSGGGGADTLEGGGGRDEIRGERGPDVLTGNGGADRFIFNHRNGRDIVTDFQQGRDKIVVESGAETFADLTITQTGADVLIQIANTRVTVQNEDVSSFSEVDFIF